jgi:hypothetical protein
VGKVDLTGEGQIGDIEMSLAFDQRQDTKTFKVASSDVATYRRDGYVIIRNVFSRHEIDEMRRHTLLQVEEHRRQGLLRTDVAKGFFAAYPDMLTSPHLRYIVLDERILTIAGDLLAPQPFVYFGFSSYSVGFNRRGWHRDNLDRDKKADAPDWAGDYPIIAVNIYLQDHSEHSGGPKVEVGSHINASGPIKFVDARIGDVVVWNFRLVHSANSIRLKVLPNAARLLPPIRHRRRLKFFGEGDIPTWMQVPHPPSPRVFLSIPFGVEGPHLSRFIREYMGAEHYSELLRHCRFGPEVWETAKERGLKILRPSPEYGRDPD